jgi:hypothetical protein
VAVRAHVCVSALHLARGQVGMLPWSLALVDLGAALFGNRHPQRFTNLEKLELARASEV